MTRIQLAAQRLIDKHGSVRKASQACGLTYSLLWKIAKGQQINPTSKTLVKLGIRI